MYFTDSMCKMAKPVETFNLMLSKLRKNFGSSVKLRPDFPKPSGLVMARQAPRLGICTLLSKTASDLILKDPATGCSWSIVATWHPKAGRRAVIDPT